MADQILTQELLHQLFQYKDGELYWKVKRGSAEIGNLVGCKSAKKYSMLSINKKTYQTHRIIFMMFHGYMPVVVDHADGNGFNNKIENLRGCTFFENNVNRSMSKGNTSGYKNVSLDKNKRKWRVAFRSKGVNMYFGMYEDLELADLVAQEARDKYHGKFAKHK